MTSVNRTTDSFKQINLLLTEKARFLLSVRYFICVCLTITATRLYRINVGLLGTNAYQRMRKDFVISLPFQNGGRLLRSNGQTPLPFVMKFGINVLGTEAQ